MAKYKIVLEESRAKYGEVLIDAESREEALDMAYNEEYDPQDIVWEEDVSAYVGREPVDVYLDE